MGASSGATVRLVWKQTVADDVCGYRILWRQPGSPVWQHREDVGAVNVYALKGISKDNFVFGVAARNAGGHASLPVFAQPVR